MFTMLTAATLGALILGQDLQHSRSLGEPWFELIDNTEGGLHAVVVNGVSGNGESVFGGISSPSGWQGFFWTRAGGAVHVGGQTLNESDFAGTRFAGGFAGIYTVGQGWQSLGIAPGSTFAMHADGISPDGQTVVGFARVINEEFSAIWTEAEGPRMLRQDDEVDEPWHALRTTNNGTVILLVTDSAQFDSWVMRDGVASPLPPNALGARDMSPDGAVIVGAGQHGPWFYRPPLGYQPIPDGPCDTSGASSTDARGGYIVGSITGNCPFIYDRFHGTRDLVQVMTQDFDLDLGNVLVREVRGISDDGRTLCGHGILDGVERSWVAYLPLLQCPGDFNADDRLDFYDVQQYLIAFAAGDLSADFVPDEVLNFFDVATYLDRYALGCL